MFCKWITSAQNLQFVHISLFFFFWEMNKWKLDCSVLDSNLWPVTWLKTMNYHLKWFRDTWELWPKSKKVFWIWDRPVISASSPLCRVIDIMSVSCGVFSENASKRRSIRKSCFSFTSTSSLILCCKSFLKVLMRWRKSIVEVSISPAYLWTHLHLLPQHLIQQNYNNQRWGHSLDFVLHYEVKFTPDCFHTNSHSHLLRACFEMITQYYCSHWELRK